MIKLHASILFVALIVGTEVLSKASFELNP
jgi:hypothetical protein